MPEITQSKYLVNIGWNDVPHLDEKTKREMRGSTLPHLLDARENGMPGLGRGAVFPVPLEQIICDPFEIPSFYPRIYALDVGWNVTAALWAAWNMQEDILYIYAEHYRQQQPPAVHASAIKARGEWIPGLIDPASRGRNQKDGTQLYYDYLGLGLNLIIADNAVEAGVMAVWERLSQGRLFIFRHLMNFQSEYRLYRRDDKGKIVKENDHLMDCLRYITLGYRDHARVRPPERRAVRMRVGVKEVAY